MPSGPEPMSLDEFMFGEPEYTADSEVLENILSPYYSNLYSDTGNLFAKTRRRRQGAYHECCMKPCYVSELYAYCNPDPATKS